MIDQNMNRREIQKRQLEINVELGFLAEHAAPHKLALMEIECKEHSFMRELAELALRESQLPPPLPQRMKHAG